ncbi:MAG: hypothetical protein V7775_10105 [Sulfitobacter sp.]|uniref:hypothetical protein n=1 Tax=Sulfitobacter undariae TaxID=1563671 RepID=UPI00161F25E3|nr:hypothetical protein [Sulfitobacter undariae]
MCRVESRDAGFAVGTILTVDFDGGVGVLAIGFYLFGFGGGGVVGALACGCCE